MPGVRTGEPWYATQLAGCPGRRAPGPEYGELATQLLAEYGASQARQCDSIEGD